MARWFFRYSLLQQDILLFIRLADFLSKGYLPLKKLQILTYDDEIIERQKPVGRHSAGFS